MLSGFRFSLFEIGYSCLVFTGQERRTGKKQHSKDIQAAGNKKRK